MNIYSTVAHEFKFSLKAGVIDRNEITRWADEIIAVQGYEDKIAEISIGINKTDKDIESLLSALAYDEDKWNGFRGMLGRMHETLRREPSRLHEFTRFLERICINSLYDVPEDVSFIIGVEDDFQQLKRID